MEKSFTISIACLADAINIMLHTQHRPGAAPAPPRCGYDEAAAPGYGGAGEQCLNHGSLRAPLLGFDGHGVQCGSTWGSLACQPALLSLRCPTSLVRCNKFQCCKFHCLVCAGAVWDLVRREDRPALRSFLSDAVAGEASCSAILGFWCGRTVATCECALARVTGGLQSQGGTDQPASWAGLSRPFITPKLSSHLQARLRVARRLYTRGAW